MIIQDYVLNIARRWARKFFGRAFSLSGTTYGDGMVFVRRIVSGLGLDEDTLGEKALANGYHVTFDQVVFRAKDEKIAIRTIIKFKSTRVTVKISKCCHFSETVDRLRKRHWSFYDRESIPEYAMGLSPPPSEEAKMPWYEKEFDVVDPQSKEQLTKFFSETYRAIKKETSNRGYMLELIDRNRPKN